MNGEDERSAAEMKRLSDAVLRRMLNTPPKRKRKARKKAAKKR